MIVKQVVLVTGISGAGKTSAMGVLEDMGYYCMDRFPVFLVNDLVNEILKDEDSSHYHRLALSVSAQDIFAFKTAFENIECVLTILHLEASFEALLLRYKYNRRNHPLLVAKIANSLEEAIKLEIEEFSRVKEYATIIIDTSLLSVHDLSKRIQEIFNLSLKQRLTISFVSFGFRHGLPMDADFVFDVRFLINPYWDETLRTMSGNDRPVYDYVINDPKTQLYLEKLKQFLDFVIEQYETNSKHHVTIAVGCTGGQHRSVSVVNWLYRQYGNEYSSYRTHRDAKEVYHD